MQAFPFTWQTQINIHILSRHDDVMIDGWVSDWRISVYVVTAGRHKLAPSVGVRGSVPDTEVSDVYDF